VPRTGQRFVFAFVYLTYALYNNNYTTFLKSLMPDELALYDGVTRNKFINDVYLMSEANHCVVLLLMNDSSRFISLK
jgi:hypothetical protein